MCSDISSQWIYNAENDSKKASAYSAQPNLLEAFHLSGQTGKHFPDHLFTTKEILIKMTVEIPLWRKPRLISYYLWHLLLVTTFSVELIYSPLWISEQLHLSSIYEMTHHLLFLDYLSYLSYILLQLSYPINVIN